MQVIPGMSRTSKRFLIVVFLLSCILPLSKLITAEAVKNATVSSLYTYHGTRGPWPGLQDDSGGWARLPHAMQTLVYAPGDVVAWEARTDVAQGVAVSADITMRCDQKVITSEDFHVLPGEMREGWKTFGLRVPVGAPDGDCVIEREARFTGPNGKTERRMFPPLYFKIGARH